MGNPVMRVLGASLVCGAVGVGAVGVGAVGAAAPFVKLLLRNVFWRGNRRCADDSAQETKAVCEHDVEDTEEYKTDLTKALELVGRFESTVEERCRREKEQAGLIDGLRAEQKEAQKHLTCVKGKLKLALAKEKEQERIIEELRVNENRQDEVIEGLRNEQKVLKECVSLNKEKPENVVEATNWKGEEEILCTEAGIETVERVRRDNYEVCEGSTRLGKLEAGSGAKDDTYSGNERNGRKKSSVVGGIEGARRRKRGTRRANKRGSREETRRGDACRGNKAIGRRKNGGGDGKEKQMTLQERLDAELCEYFRAEAVGHGS